MKRSAAKRSRQHDRMLDFEKPDVQACCINMFPFPFFGPGDAAYFEWVTMTVYFKNTPTGEMGDCIIELAPPPFDLSEEDFKGRFLEAMSDHFIHASVAEAYDGEASGTEFSEWHFWSKDQLPALLESLSTGDEEL